MHRATAWRKAAARDRCCPIRRDRLRPGDDPRVRSAIATQDALSRLAPGTGEDSAADVRRWREIR